MPQKSRTVLDKSNRENQQHLRLLPMQKPKNDLTPQNKQTRL